MQQIHRRLLSVNIVANILLLLLFYQRKTSLQQFGGMMPSWQ